MELRDWTNKHPKIVIAIAGACVVIGLSVLAYQLIGNRQKISAKFPDHYYSIDDGKTAFTASGDNIAPFDYEGKQAARVHMFECDGKPFIGYLERYTPEARKALLAKSISPELNVNGREFKRPGDAEWTPAKERAAVKKLINVSPPAGSTGTPTPVEP